MALRARRSPRATLEFSHSSPFFFFNNRRSALVGSFIVAWVGAAQLVSRAGRFRDDSPADAGQTLHEIGASAFAPDGMAQSAHLPRDRSAVDLRAQGHQSRPSEAGDYFPHREAESRRTNLPAQGKLPFYLQSCWRLFGKRVFPFVLKPDY